MVREIAPVTPGELLQEEFLIPMGISQYRLAKEIGVSARRINEIVKGMRAVTADTDLRLCRFFSLSDGYWLRAQVAYDTEVAKDVLAGVLAKITPFEHVTSQ
ncbi:HigA family addiction module antitoxin [Pusillimonas sp. SM2304]|uniref:HigA family addiction module antitoxin n=1 Tax=Pusillimonas sp. SM2304 TaxID=3073241 RepID=UPI0028753D5D|nr:HigA family addiction module antitoxin [Pusillimonas sp. SM2304]MDS1140082.1 HigA family addiction module antitoxin [Pusillimonas sp. SM2304]